MAIRLQDKQNVAAPDSDYPYGQIKDDAGAGDGTPVDVAVYGDFHQFFARMFALSGLTYNGLPDNDYSGFQYIEAATKLWKTFDGIKIISTDTILTIADLGKLIVVTGNAIDIDVFLPKSTDSEDGDAFTILNYSAYSVSVRRRVPDAIFFEAYGGIKLALPTIGDYSTFVCDKGNTDWYAINYRIKPTVKISQQITLATQLTSSATYVDMTGLTYTNTSGVSKKFKLTLKTDSDLDGTSGAGLSIAQAFYRIYDNTNAVVLDESQTSTSIFVTAATQDVGAVITAICTTIVTMAAGDVVKCQFKLTSGYSVTATMAKFLIEELES